MYTSFMKIIEFIGYPGSGKSYISTFCEKYFFENKGLRVLSVEDLRNSLLRTKFKKALWYTKLFISQFYKISFIVTFFEILFSRKSLKHLKYYIDIYGSYSLVRKQANYDYCIISEGFISFATYLFSNIKDEKVRKEKRERYLRRHLKYIKKIHLVLRIFNISEEDTLFHTGQKRNISVQEIKAQIKNNDFNQTTLDHVHNLEWCEKNSILIGNIENKYQKDEDIAFQLKKYII